MKGNKFDQDMKGNRICKKTGVNWRNTDVVRKQVRAKYERKQDMK